MKPKLTVRRILELARTKPQLFVGGLALAVLATQYNVPDAHAAILQRVSERAPEVSEVPTVVSEVAGNYVDHLRSNGVDVQLGTREWDRGWDRSWDKDPGWEKSWDRETGE
jgi:hypothetical protein